MLQVIPLWHNGVPISFAEKMQANVGDVRLADLKPLKDNFIKIFIKSIDKYYLIVYSVSCKATN